MRATFNHSFSFHWLIAAMLAAIAAAQTDPVPPSTLTLEQVATKLKAAESATDLDDATKAKVVEFLRSTQSRLEDSQKHSVNAAKFTQAIESAPKEAAAVREQLQTSTVAPTATLDLPIEPTSKDIEAKLATETASLVTLKNRQGDLDRQIQDQQGRPEKARAELTTAKQKLSEIESALKSPPPDGEHPMLTEARRANLEARRLSRTNEVQSLEQELLSYDGRLQLLTAQRDLTTRQVARAEANVKTINDMLTRAQTAEREQARAYAKLVLRQQFGNQPVVMRLSGKVIELSDSIAEVEKAVQRTNVARDPVARQLKEITEEFGSAEKKIDLVGLTESLGVILRDQRRNLPDARKFRKGAAERSERLSDIRLTLLKIDDQLKALGDIESLLTTAIDAEVNGSLTDTQRVELEAVARRLLEHQRELTGKLAEAHRRHLNELNELELQQKQLISKVAAYASFLDDRLLWIRSAPRLSTGTFKDVATGVAWIVSPTSWGDAVATLSKDISRLPILWVVMGLTIVGLFVTRRKLRIQMNVVNGQVDLAYADHFGLTVHALIVTLLIVLLWPLLMWLIGWRLHSDGTAGEHTRATGIGLMNTAYIFAGLHLLETVCASKGLAEVHLQWPNATTQIIRRNTQWVLWIILPASFVIALTEWQADEVYRHGIGRVAFVIAMIVLTILIQRILRPRGPVIQPILSTAPEGWLSRLRYVWYPVMMAGPLFLAAMAMLGYHYTAIRLERRFSTSVFLIVIAIVLHALVYRWLRVAHRRLVIEREREQKARAESTIDTALTGSVVSDEGTATSVPLDEPEVDPKTVEAQTRQLVRTLVGTTVIVGLWMIWSNVLPALGVLDDVTLWDRMVKIDGQDKPVPVSLGNLALAIIVGIVTVVAAKNLPGVFEILVLKRLPFDAGSRYAMSTVCQYIIVAIGVVIAFNEIGVGWTQVQWLIAALGVGLGFGLQEIFANFVSGLILLFERPIRVGDIVTVGDVSGVVSRIRIRATTITNWDRKEFIVPNKEFITGRLLNWTLTDKINRIVINVGVAYGSDTDKAKGVLHQVCHDHPLILDEPETRVTFEGFGDSTLNFVVRTYLPDLDNRLAVIHELHTAIDKAFRAAGIEIAFPQRDLHLRSADTSITVAKQDETRDG